MPSDTERLTDALVEIKALVCGDRSPHWDSDVAVTLTRWAIADIVDAAMQSTPPNAAPQGTAVGDIEPVTPDVE